MIIVDTNVVSEPMQVRPSAAVVAWLDRQAAETLYLTSVTLAELLVGVEALPAGRRRSGLRTALGDLLASLFGPRILPFDAEAAKTYAVLVTRASAAGAWPMANASATFRPSGAAAMSSSIWSGTAARTLACMAAAAPKAS